MAKLDRERLRILIADSGRSMRALSLQAGLGETGVKDILNGKSRDPKFHTIIAIANQLDVPVERLLEEGDAAIAAASIEPLRRGHKPPPATLPIRNDVQAGAWLEIDELDQREPEEHPAPVDPRFPRAAQWLSRVRGDSMNALTNRSGAPAGILDGDLAHVVDAIAMAYVPRTGDVVEAERSRFDGREREITLKQVEVAPDGQVQLWPRSSNPRWREPLQLHDGDPDAQGVVVRIRGKVLQVLREI